jgi:excisionase family DNA binding protein
MVCPMPESSVIALPALLLNLPAASSITGLTIWQLRGLIASGELPVVRVGRKLYLRRATLTRWAERAEGKHRTETRWRVERAA